MAKKILLVGEHLNTELWEDTLRAKGFDCTSVSTMMEAIDHLKSSPDAATTQLLVQDNLPIIPVERELRKFPQEFKEVRGLDRGAALIAYVRKEGLIASDSPAYLASVFSEKEKYKTAPEGVTKVIRIGMVRSVAEDIEPAHHRPDARERSLGE